MALKNNFSSVLDCFARGESTWIDKVCMAGAEGGEVFLSFPPPLPLSVSAMCCHCIHN